jgi:hypothetical protein
MPTLHQRGLYDVDALRYDCPLPGVRYQVRVRRDPYKQDGQCAQAPRISFTLLRNGSPVLQDIPFGDDCYVVFALKSLQVTETGNHTGMRLCYGLCGDPDLCMEVGAEYKAIGTRHGKQKTVRHPPIDKNIFEELTEPSRWLPVGPLKKSP